MAASAPGRYGGKAMSDELRKLASDIHDIEPDGTPITKEQMLAKLIWQQALGWTEKVRDDNGILREIKHPPVGWAQQYLFERTEGKAAVAQVEAQTGMKAAEKVRELSTKRLNALVKKP